MTARLLSLTHGPIFLCQKIFDELEDGLDPNMIYVLDEAQEIHARHANNIRRLIKNARHAKILVVTRSPSAFSSMEGIEDHIGRARNRVRSCIADHLTEEQATQVAIALDGHPLAIQMWRMVTRYLHLELRCGFHIIDCSGQIRF